jgi:hypothetical protein
MKSNEPKPERARNENAERIAIAIAKKTMLRAETKLVIEKDVTGIAIELEVLRIVREEKAGRKMDTPKNGLVGEMRKMLENPGTDIIAKTTENDAHQDIVTENAATLQDGVMTIDAATMPPTMLCTVMKMPLCFPKIPSH